MIPKEEVVKHMPTGSKPVNQAIAPVSHSVPRLTLN